MFAVSINYTNGTSTFFGNRAASSAATAVAEVRAILKELGLLRGCGVKNVVATAI